LSAEQFETELDRWLPLDVPERGTLVRLASQHLSLIAEVNRQFNLTRIMEAREAAIKHVVDSVMPWRLFAKAQRVLDAGTGAGFPGIPLAIVLPETRFTLAESIQKKARFVALALDDLKLPNAVIEARRAEELAASGQFQVITARAVAPLERALKLFGPALRRGSRLLLYKGPEVADEITAAEPDLRRLRAAAEIVMRYELPESMGSRTVVEVAART
jgi:16S rRNA (guanine527-N7)-methyltransferase